MGGGVKVKKGLGLGDKRTGVLKQVFLPAPRVGEEGRGCGASHLLVAGQVLHPGRGGVVENQPLELQQVEQRLRRNTDTGGVIDPSLHNVHNANAGPMTHDSGNRNRSDGIKYFRYFHRPSPGGAAHRHAVTSAQQGISLND